jgi:hypothetical protein
MWNGKIPQGYVGNFLLNPTVSDNKNGIVFEYLPCPDR